jgi:hypothetical protein
MAIVQSHATWTRLTYSGAVCRRGPKRLRALLIARSLAGAYGLVAGVPRGADAQLQVPALHVADRGNRPVSHAEAEYHVWMNEARVKAKQSFRDAHYPVDSMLRVVSDTGLAWLTRLGTRSVSALQYEAAGNVNVIARHERQAQQKIAARLAVPGISLAERGYTLYTAVEIFSNFRYPNHLPIAERYLDQLTALGDSAGWRQIHARRILLNAYYLLGQSADVARHGTLAINRLRGLPYFDQDPYELRLTDIYLKTVEALGGQSDARPKIEALDTTLRMVAGMEVPTDVVALDPRFAWKKQERLGAIEYMIRAGARIGTQGQSLISNYWVNRPTTDSADIPVNDGKIRLLEIFSYGCDGCLTALHSLQRIQQQHPGVEAVAAAFTLGAWANRLVTPEEEAEHLNKYFTKQLKITFPIAIWKWPRVLNPDGGTPTAGVWETPLIARYPNISKPTTFVLDGQGRIRRIFIGAGRDVEEQMVATVAFLQREAKISTKTSSKSPMANASGTSTSTAASSRP